MWVKEFCCNSLQNVTQSIYTAPHLNKRLEAFPLAVALNGKYSGVRHNFRKSAVELAIASVCKLAAEICGESILIVIL